jgi:hypothetical protein
MAAMSVDEFVAAMEEYDIAQPSRQALLERNIGALCEIENARGVMFCMIATPDGSEERNLPEQDDAPEPDEERDE